MAGGYENIERCVQLHERLYVYYTVDGYEASIWTLDGDRKVIKAKGDDMEHALKLLDKQCANLSWVDIRKMPEIV